MLAVLAVGSLFVGNVIGVMQSNLEAHVGLFHYLSHGFLRC